MPRTPTPWPQRRPRTAHRRQGVCRGDSGRSRIAGDRLANRRGRCRQRQRANNVNQFYEQAKAAFLQGNYRDATHLAAHAAVDDPKSPTVHLLLVLGMFATGEYRGAAMEAHAVALLGKTPAWSVVYEFLRRSGAVHEAIAGARKIRGREAETARGTILARVSLYDRRPSRRGEGRILAALRLTPRDRVAAQLLKSQGGEVPAGIAKQLADMPPLPAANRPPSCPSRPSRIRRPPSKGRYGVVAATADSAILDRCPAWFDLAQGTIIQHVPNAWVVKLAGDLDMAPFRPH